MSKIEVPTWIFVTLCFLMALCGGVLLLVNYGYDSERSKRIELEAEIHRHICKVFERGTFYTQLWPTEQFGMSLQEMFDRNHEALDSLPAVPPESEVTE